MYYFGEVNNQVYLLRSERRWSQSELADKLGITRQTIAAIEKSKFIPSLELAFAIAFVFERELHEVFQFQPKITNEEE